ncbi:MAG: PAS domain S-box protein [Burkholderiaceae bacterium]|nr:PAS domain S-box protein [Burkholderiaceae bacterium]
MGELGLLGGGGLPLLRALLDAIPARVVVLDASECLVYANDEFFAFTGLHPKQVLGQAIGRVIGPEAYAGYGPLREKLKLGVPVSWEGWVTLAGRGRRYMREQLIPCGPAHAPLDAVIVISLDWTALKQREAELSAKVQELETTEALKSSIVDHALAAIVSADAQGRVVEFNPAAEAMFGVSREQALGRPVAEVIIPRQHRQAHEAGMRRVTEGGAPRLLGRRVEMTALRADGGEFPVEMVLWRTMVGGQTFYTASMFDLTERRDAQAEIERQRDALRQSEKLTAMGSLLAGVAHELNNPLAIVMGRASLLEEKLANTAHAADALRIREAAERCGRIVRAFLNMARQRPSVRSPVLLNDLVQAATDMLQYALRSHDIALRLELTPGLPEIHADPDQIGQIVLNLLVNAQQALMAVEGLRRLSVSTGLEQRRTDREPRLWLRVSDNGAGVPPELREQVFAPFFTTKAEGVGTGMGLAVSRSIAQSHGGSLLLEDGQGGASFRLSLPLSGEAGPASAAAPLDALDSVAAARLLVVDDEGQIAELMRDFLCSAGYEVAVAESGSVALAMLAESGFDAIVSDLRMPDIDGAALWRTVRQRDPALARRMLFVTGDTLSPSARVFLDQSRCAGLDKPFTKAELLRAVQLLLSGPS